MFVIVLETTDGKRTVDHVRRGQNEEEVMGLVEMRPQEASHELSGLGE